MSYLPYLSSAPRADWLTKISRVPFGPLRSQRRFFVLLDSELRYYKDEYDDIPIQNLDLRSISHVFPTHTAGQKHAFRLEPYPTTAKNNRKPWILACNSHTDVEQWVDAIRTRLARFNMPLMTTSVSLPWPPLRRPRNLTHSLSHRRCITIPPIKTSHSTSTRLDTISTGDSSLVSPETSPVASFPLSPPQYLSLIDAFDDEEDITLIDSSKPPHVTFKVAGTATEEDAEPSPSFLLYKEKFHL